MIDPVLKHHFNNFKTTFEIDITGESPDQEKRKETEAFEKFVNYVLFSLDYPDIFTADMELLDFVCVGGSHDTGIDGIGVRINDRIVRNIEEVKKITDASKKINVEFVFIQSKMRSGVNISEFNKFGLGVKNFFSDGYLPENIHLREIREIKDYIYSDRIVISKLDNNPSLNLYFVSIGPEPTDENFVGAREMLKKELSDGEFFFDTIEIKAIGGKQLIKSCRELENKFEVQLNIIDIFPLIVDLKEDIKKAYTFTCKASEFLKTLEKEDGSLRRALFNDNVRDYLGSRSAVNNEMESTIQEAPEMFLLCNNGITIVCTDFEQVRDKLIKIENPQIVNGCQTSNSIFNLRDDPNINKVQILVRVISTENINISNKIVRGNNKQNQVLDEAFEAILPFHQEILEPFFLASESDVKIYYERRAKQYNNDPLIKKSHIVNLRILTQTFVAMFLEAPQESHRHEAKLLEKYAGDIESRKIFRDSHSPYPYYISALTWYMFEKYFREGKIGSGYKAYKAHLYLICRYSLGEFPPGLNRSKKIDAYCEKLFRLLKEPQFENQVQKVLNVFDTTQQLWLDMGRSQFGMKDSNYFAEVLIKQARKTFIQQQTPKVDDESSLNEGTILNIIWRNGIWFGFIKREWYKENIYFDSREFKGDIESLARNMKVKYDIDRGPRGEYAKNVVIVE